MRIFFAADAHGSTEVWKKWLNTSKHHDPDVLMLCGDLTSKALVPIIEERKGYTCHYFDKKWKLKTEEDVRKMEDRLAAVGVLSMRCTPEEVAELQADQKKVTKTIHDAIMARMKEWLDLLVKRIDTKKITVIAMPGNDDDPDVDAIIKSYEDRGVIYPLDRVVKLNGYELISLAHVTPTPWDTPREMTEEQFEKEIDRLMGKVKDPRKAILNFHMPPHETTLDLAPELTKDLKVVSDLSHVVMTHVGSKAIRSAIERYQPLLGLHGHIHESDGLEWLGETVVINPGSEYEKGILRGYIIDIVDDKIGSYLRISG